MNISARTGTDGDGGTTVGAAAESAAVIAPTGAADDKGERPYDGWYRMTFSTAQVAAGRVRGLAHQMAAVIAALDDPNTDALLMDQRAVTEAGGGDATGAGAVGRAVFVSPAAARAAPALVARHRATPCGRPDHHGLNLLAGRIPGYSRFRGVTPPGYRRNAPR